MIVSIDWLNEFVDFDLSPKDLADRLTGAGLESSASSNGESLDIELTPNRPDCMSHLGVAREIALLTGSKPKQVEVTLDESKHKAGDEVTIEIENKEGCPRYAARVVKGVTVGKSPDWMVSRLEQCGIRAINNIVDVSNYVLLELGHPLHAFDLDLVEGNRIVVRSAKKGESFVTLDGEERKLSRDHLVIADEKNPVGLAGIMGGENSEVTEGTTDLLIECAYFDPVTVRRGAKRLGMSTEASKRFERGADHDDLITALDRTAQLISELAGGEIYSGIIDCYPKTVALRKVALSVERASASIGAPFDDKFIRKTLQGLGINFKTANGSYECEIPSFRPDLEREIDLIEELARVYGFDRIESKNTYVGHVNSIVSDDEEFIDQLRDYFSSAGFCEVVTNSLVSENDATITSGSTPLPVANPLSREMSIMRPTLFSGLLNAVRHNLRRGEKDLALFEYGTVFEAEGKGWREFPMFSGVACGERTSKGWRSDPQNHDIYFLKGVMLDFASRLGSACQSETVKADDLFSLRILFKTWEGSLGEIGSIRREILEEYGIDLPVVGFDLNVDLIDSTREPIKFLPLPLYPTIDRDLSLTVPSSVKIGELEAIIQTNGGELLRKARLYDLYEGAQVGAGMKSVTFSLSFRSDDRTLKDEEVDEIMAGIISETSTRLGAKLR